MVWTYDNQRQTVRPSRIEETGAQTNFYSVQLDDGTYYDGLDEWLRAVEDAAARPYEQLLAGTIPLGQARADFATFVASLYARSPALIRANAIGYAQFLQHMTDLQLGDRDRFEAFMDKWEAESGREPTDRDKLFEFWADRDRYTIAISQKKGLTALSVSDELAEIMYGRWWYLLDATSGFFITSDSPVYRGTPESQHGPLMGDGGFRNPAAEITVPLSPQRMLLITGQKFTSDRFLMSGDQVWSLNRARAIAADRFLYSHVKDDRVSQIASDHKDTPERFRIHGAGPFSEVKVTR
jgi:hypothetical protein